MSRDGYVWWYVDAVSDDGREALTIICFIGSVFSPYYAWTRRKGPTDPARHCCMNVVLYGASANRWAMTERGAASLARDATTIRIGPSGLRWEGGVLTVDFDEVTAPIPGRLKGRLRVHADAVTPRAFTLDPAGAHRWWPIAPSSRVEVVLEKPALSWKGRAYFDTNDGSEPLEKGFKDWDWCRAPLKDGGAAILYETRPLDGPSRCLSLRIGRDGSSREIEPPPPVMLPKTRLWRIRRASRSQAPEAARVAGTLEDTPFYARSLLSLRLAGEDATAVHESLDMRRFTNPLVQAMLPFRMPRAFGR
ncbi:Hydroxyneurosporene dehydrogenase [Caenispirillum salinarum AK4]|uniref:Hydroxyneurosporene dehydrogenase n=1 Tax=Caenispirillum salinarum AK4 TaxID=1238182 RepID=K9HXD8_9PROT|nr:carotenoid 1,2-hydratase [Caenispirillum salinarum]EKV32846.1 Hydroxyneurosporene dehydrogenase [Caenispirillum salinarum AK4]